MPRANMLRSSRCFRSLNASSVALGRSLAIPAAGIRGIGQQRVRSISGSAAPPPPIPPITDLDTVTKAASAAASASSTVGALDGFWQSVALVGASELGDKTFFLSAIIAMKEGKGVAFAGSMSALTLLTGASVGLGSLSRQLPLELLSPGGIPLIDLAAAGAFSVFGVRMLREASAAEAAANEEKDEAEHEAEAALSKTRGRLGALLAAASLVFVAELGDKSMIATIALAKDYSAAGVMAGSLVGHAAATGLAVVGGSSLSRYLSPVAISRAGGVLFLLFAAATLAQAAGVLPDEEEGS